MTATVESILLGGTLTLFCAISFILNLCVLIVLIRGRFVRSHNCSSVYILAFANVAGSALLMLIYTSYLGPSSILQNFLLPGEHGRTLAKFTGFLFHGQWIQDLLIQDITSLNRLITVIYPHGIAYFTPRRTIIYSILSFVMGYFVSWAANYGLPCCSFYLYHKSYSYTFLDGSFNVSNYYLDIPLNIFCSVFAVGCYIIIYSYVRVSNRKVTHTMEKTVQQQRKRQELRYAFQFAFCTICCICIWVGFRIFGSFIPNSDSPLFVICSFFQVAHSSSTALVFLLFNKEIRVQFNRHILRTSESRRVTIISVAIPPARTTFFDRSYISKLKVTE